MLGGMTLREFIAALGGADKAATLFGIGRTAVQNWLAAGRMPARWHYRAARLAAERRLSFDPEAVAEERAE